MKSRKNTGIAVYVIITSLVFFLVGSCHKGDKSYTFETAIVKKGSIINTITATGTIQADTTVLIGTQVSGVIKKIYVDFNSNVKKGQLLAELDKTPLQTQVQQAQASLDDSKSEVEFQTATYERYKALLDKKLVAQADYDQVKYSYDKARANLKTAQAGYDKSIVNLNYASIYSPIVGVVLNRAVDQGQTVAASFSTPNLFTIGNDLTQMQVQANVDEADIGQVRTDEPVDFTVDAYPNEIFKGSVRQIRLQPIVTSNVVTYTVIVNAPNPEKKLMPGMTANITVLVQKVDSVMIIPGKALRFTPDAAFLSEYMKNNPMGQRQGTGGAGRPAGTGGTAGPAGTGGTAGTGLTGGTPGTAANQPNPGGFQAGGQTGKKPVIIWVKDGENVRRVRVVTGAIDGTNAEIKSGLKEGDEVILSMTLASKSTTTTAAATPTTTNPFMPQRPPQGTRGR
ncbi:MAG: efflux RND transporter periplasmic adaptor subunit [Bacteroidales bacterium]|jgi:HlyD family secretion protein